MKYIDISMPLSENMATYPGNTPYKQEVLKTLENDDVASSRIILSTHTGTHVDAPRHFVKGGKSIDQVDPALLNGTCKVIDCTYIESLIQEADITDLTIEKGDRILFKTQNSDYILASDFVPAFISLGLSAAQYLANIEVALVGIDYLGIEAKGSPGHPVHKALLKHGIPIVEGLNLHNVEPGEYELLCLPLKITGADGSPCRALLRM